MASKNRPGEFRVTGRVLIEVDVSVRAASLEQALEAARSMSTTDFVEPKGDHLDSSLIIAGVWDVDRRQTL